MCWKCAFSKNKRLEVGNARANQSSRINRAKHSWLILEQKRFRPRINIHLYLTFCRKLFCRCTKFFYSFLSIFVLLNASSVHDFQEACNNFSKNSKIADSCWYAEDALCCPSGFPFFALNWNTHSRYFDIFLSNGANQNALGQILFELWISYFSFYFPILSYFFTFAPAKSYRTDVI